MYWWYVLNRYQHVFNTNMYAFNTYCLTGWIQAPIHSPILSQYNQVQTNSSTNLDRYKHQYRPMHTSLFSILAPVHANTGFGNVKSGAPACNACRACTPFYLCVRGIWVSQAVHVLCSRINHILLLIIRLTQTDPQCFMPAKLSMLQQNPQDCPSDDLAERDERKSYLYNEIFCCSPMSKNTMSSISLNWKNDGQRKYYFILKMHYDCYQWDRVVGHISRRRSDLHHVNTGVVYWSGMLHCSEEKYDTSKQSKTKVTHLAHKMKLKLTLCKKCQSTSFHLETQGMQI